MVAAHFYETENANSTRKVFQDSGLHLIVDGRKSQFDLTDGGDCIKKYVYLKNNSQNHRYFVVSNMHNTQIPR